MKDERIRSSLSVGELRSAELAVAIRQHSLPGKPKLRIQESLFNGGKRIAAGFRFVVRASGRA